MLYPLALAPLRIQLEKALRLREQITTLPRPEKRRTIPSPLVTLLSIRLSNPPPC